MRSPVTLSMQPARQGVLTEYEKNTIALKLYSLRNSLAVAIHMVTAGQRATDIALFDFADIKSMGDGRVLWKVTANKNKTRANIPLHATVSEHLLRYYCHWHTLACFLHGGECVNKLLPKRQHIAAEYTSHFNQCLHKAHTEVHGRCEAVGVRDLRSVRWSLFLISLCTLEWRRGSSRRKRHTKRNRRPKKDDTWREAKENE